MMPSPFPGMDPYIERPEIWPDFHDCFIAALRGELQPRLRPKYAALTQDRLYLIESQRPIYPDVSVVEAFKSNWRAEPSTVAVVETDASVVFKVDDEEVREPYIEIIEASSGRVVTAIEVLSPANKDRGNGQEAYKRKRDEYWDAGTNLVEIDLLRGDSSAVKVSGYKLDSLHPFDYVVAVSRRNPPQHEVYAFSIEQRMPRVAIPLQSVDPDIGLDLQIPFNRCWEEGPYPAVSQYDQPPPGKMSAERVDWCKERLRGAGFLK